MVLWNSYRSAEDLQFWLKRLAYFSAPTNMAWLRINRSYFECSPRVISDPWTSWRKTSLSKSYKSKLGRVLHLRSTPALGRPALWGSGESLTCETRGQDLRTSEMLPSRKFLTYAPS